MADPTMLSTQFGVSPALKLASETLEKQLMDAIQHAVAAKVPRVIIVGFLQLHLHQYSTHAVNEG